MRRRSITVIGLAIWVVIGFVVAELLVSALLLGLRALGVSFGGISSATLETVTAALVYIVSLAIVIGVPWRLRHHITSRREIGLWRLVSWSDIGYSLGGVVVYILLSAALIALVSHLLPSFPTTQPQDVGFQHLTQRYEYVLAFATLVVVAPFAEETLFRGYLYGKIRKRAPFWVTMLVVSLVFASLHVPGVNADGSVQWQWNVALDVFALSLVLTSLREYTGSIWAGVLLHAIKNAIAFYFLFVVPLHSIMGV